MRECTRITILEDPLERKYQVFVSSTYEDLQRERQEVMHVLLELDCIPSGMELFPAADEDQWSLIRGVIDDCDYYIVIIAGRYGSIGSDVLSYTEMEYRYAAEQGKPIVSFLHGAPNMLPAQHVEETDEGKSKLERFRKFVQKKMCKEWTTAHELGSVVARSLNQLRKAHPGIGWVRGDQVPSDHVTTEILRLRDEVERLERELAKTRTHAPPGTEGLSQGDDLFDIRYTMRLTTNLPFADVQLEDSIKLSWNDIFHTISPLLIREATESSILVAVNDRVRPKARDRMSHSDEYSGHEIGSLDTSRDCFRTIIVQLRALGLIETSTDRARSVKDRATYWRLTPYGDTVMNRLRAIKRHGDALVEGNE